MKRPPKAVGALRPKIKPDKSSLTRNGLLRGLKDRSVSWAAARGVNLYNPISLRLAFIALETGSLCRGQSKRRMFKNKCAS